MTRNVLLIGRTGVVIDDALHQLDGLDVRPFGGTGIDDVRSAFASGDIDHVVIGAGIDLDMRLQIAREVFQRSNTATVHMKDRATGPEGFLPFARAVLRGLEDYPL